MAQDTSIKIEIAAHGAAEVGQEYARMAEALARISSAADDARAKAQLFEAEAKKASERVLKLNAQLDNWRSKLESGGSESAVAAGAVATLERQIAEVTTGMQEARKAAADWSAQAEVAATAQGTVAAAAQEVAEAQQTLAAASQDVAEAQVVSATAAAKLTVAEAKAAQTAAHAAATRVEQGRMVAAFDQEMAEARRAVARAEADGDETAAEAAMMLVRALDQSQKAAMRGLRPYERTAFVLEALRQRYGEAAQGSETYAQAVGKLTTQLDNQTRRSLENRDRSISALLDEVKGAVEAEHASIRAIRSVATGAAEGIKALVPGLGAFAERIGEARGAGAAWSAQVAQHRVRVLEMAEALERQLGEIADLQKGLRQQRRTLEEVGLETDETRQAMARLVAAELDLERQAKELSAAQADVGKAIEVTGEASQRGAATIGAMLGVLGAVAAAALAAGTAFVSLGVSTANAGAQIENAAMRSGVAVQEMSRFRAMLARLSTGETVVEMQDLREAFVQLTNYVTDAADPMSEQAQVLRALGLEASKLRQMKPEEAFIELADAMGRAGDEFVRSDAAARIFGEDTAAKILPVVREGEGAIRRWQEANDRLGLTLGEEAIRRNKKYEQSVRSLSLEWTAIKETVGQMSTGMVEAAVSGWAAKLERQKESALRMRAGLEALMGETDGEYQRALKTYMEARDADKRAAEAEVKATLNRQQSKAEAESYAEVVRGDVTKAWEAAKRAVEAEEAAEKAAADKRKAAGEARVRERAAVLAMIAKLELDALEGDARVLEEARRARVEAETAVADARKRGALTAAEAERALGLVVAQEARARREVEKKAEEEKYRASLELAERLRDVLEAQGGREATALERIAADEREALAELRQIYADAAQAGISMRVDLAEGEARIVEAAGVQRRQVALEAERALLEQVDSLRAEALGGQQQAVLESARQQAQVEAELARAYSEALTSLEQAGMASDQRRLALREAYERAVTDAAQRGVKERSALAQAEALEAGRAWQGVVNEAVQGISGVLTSSLSAIEQAATATAARLTEIERKRAEAQTDAEAEMYDAQKRMSTEHLERQRKDALRLFRLQQLLQVAQAGMAASLAVIQSLAAPGGAANPLNLAAAIAAGVAGAASVAQIAMQEPPSFHVGGIVGEDVRRRAAGNRPLAGDEQIARVRAGETVRTPAQERALQVALDSRVELRLGTRAIASVAAKQRTLR